MIKLWVISLVCSISMGDTATTCKLPAPEMNPAYAFYTNQEACQARLNISMLPRGVIGQCVETDTITFVPMFGFTSSASVPSTGHQIACVSSQSDSKQSKHDSECGDDDRSQGHDLFIGIADKFPSSEETKFERGVWGGAVFWIGLVLFGCFAFVFWWLLTR